MRTGVQRVSFDAGEDTIPKTLATKTAVAIRAATDCPVLGIQFPIWVLCYAKDPNKLGFLFFLFNRNAVCGTVSKRYEAFFLAECAWNKYLNSGSFPFYYGISCRPFSLWPLLLICLVIILLIVLRHSNLLKCLCMTGLRSMPFNAFFRFPLLSLQYVSFPYLPSSQ